jgi:hypothetical protein
MTQKDYAKHAGISPARVSQLVRDGMPLLNLYAADAWRGSRADQNDSARAADPQSVVVVNAPAMAHGVTLPGSKERVDRDDVRDAYNRQRLIEREAFELAMASIRNGHRDAGRLVCVHASAVSNLAKLQGDVLALEEREGQLVDAGWVRKAMAEHDGAAISLARSMPKTMAGRIAPHDPVFAEGELTRWVDDVFLKTMNATNPWKEKEVT